MNNENFKFIDIWLKFYIIPKTLKGYIYDFFKSRMRNFVHNSCYILTKLYLSLLILSKSLENIFPETKKYPKRWYFHFNIY